MSVGDSLSSYTSNRLQPKEIKTINNNWTSLWTFVLLTAVVLLAHNIARLGSLLRAIKSVLLDIKVCSS